MNKHLETGSSLRTAALAFALVALTACGNPAKIVEETPKSHTTTNYDESVILKNGVDAGATINGKNNITINDHIGYGSRIKADVDITIDLNNARKFGERTDLNAVWKVESNVNLPRNTTVTANNVVIGDFDGKADIGSGSTITAESDVNAGNTGKDVKITSGHADITSTGDRNIVNVRDLNIENGTGIGTKIVTKNATIGTLEEGSTISVEPSGNLAVNFLGKDTITKLEEGSSLDVKCAAHRDANIITNGADTTVTIGTSMNNDTGICNVR